jgi:superfamily II DNA or RNA helicase
MTNDLFIYDAERFNSLASHETVQQSLRYVAERKVIALNKQDHALIAQVEDPEADETYTVTLTYGNANKLTTECACTANDTRCKHALAALYSYNRFVERQQKQIETSKQEALQAFIDKGEHDTRVKLISGHLGFGVWQATSALVSANGNQAYQVHLRSLNKQVNYCTCPDLNRYRLGSCQHIAAVLHYIHSKADYSTLQEAGPPLSFVYLAWENNKPAIRLFPIATLNPDLSAICAEYFSPNKTFMGHLPSDFFRFCERVRERDDFHIGEDALHFAQQCEKQATHAERAECINQEILQSNGVISGIKTDGVAFLASRGKALLADDMGLGKTLQAITAAACLNAYGDVNKVLVACPASLKYHWAREIKKFTQYTATIIQGNDEQRVLQYHADTVFIIVSYEVLLRDIELINKELAPDLLILDELQRHKNWRSRIIPKLKRISYSYIFVLSSVALDSHLNTLYSLLHLVDRHILAPAWRYLLDYQLTDEQNTVLGYRNLTALHKRIAPVTLRREYSTVSHELLEKTEVHLDIPLDKKQRELHDAAMLDARQLAQLAARKTLTPGEQHRLMAALQQARMACNAAGLIDKTTQGSPKLHELSYLLEHLCQHNHHKVVVFSQWAVMTEMVEALVQQMGLVCLRLHSGLNSQERSVLINSFKKDQKVQVFIATDAGGVGLNLQSATVLINLDMPWNPAILDQRIGRIYKSGQKNKILIFSMLAEDAYEQHITKLVKSQRELFDNIISPESSDDVVGVSKKMLQTLIDALSTNADTSSIEQPAIAQQLIPVAIHGQNADEQRLQQLIETTQNAFKYRLQKILGSLSGILVVVHPINSRDESTAQQLFNNGIPVAVIDKQTLLGLTRLEACSTLTTLPVVFENTIQTQTNPLTQLANAKLNSATLLLAQKATAGVLDLLASAMLLQAAAIAGQFQAPAIDTITVWLHNEILPQQLLTQEQAATIIRVVSLQQSQDVPLNLIAQAMTDAELFCVQHTNIRE